MTERKKSGLKAGDPRTVEIGRSGGKALLAARGPEFFREIGTRGGQATKAKYGSEFFSRIGTLGGETVKRDRGVEFYESLGRTKRKPKT